MEYPEPLNGVATDELVDLLAHCDDPHELDLLVRAIEDELTWRPFPYQEPPAIDWTVWLFLGGRFTGKTDTDAGWLDAHAQGPPCDPRVPGGHRMSIVGPTHDDVVDACYYGPSGMRAHNPLVTIHHQAGTILRWPNGAEARIFGGHSVGDVERFRAGGNRCVCWVEEAAAIPQLDLVWEQIPFAHRLGPNPRVVLSTTPKPRGLLKRLVGHARTWATSGATPTRRWERVVMTRASSDMNPTIEPDVVAGLYELHQGTRLGRQELEGELLDDYEGALWKRHTEDGKGVDDLMVEQPPTLVMRYVGVDPSAWGLKGDQHPEEGTIARGVETGIIVNGLAADRQLYTLADYSKRCSPAEWADRVLDAYWRWHCGAVVFETNMGGAMGPAIIQAQEQLRRLNHPDDDLAPVRFYREPKSPTRIGVHAADGKRARAEPVAALSELRRHHFVGSLPLLVDQLCGWDPNEPWSPDRLDAMVWAATALRPWRVLSSAGLGSGGRRGSLTH